MPADPTTVTVTVVGLGADGWPGLSPTARTALESAEVLLGSPRQLALLPPSATAPRVAWNSPLSEGLPRLLEEYRGRRICVLASGDPTFHGIGTTLVRLLGVDAVRVIPHPSSVSLACARLGWAQDQVQVVSLVTNPVERLHPHLHPARRILVLSRGAQSPAEVAELLVARGYGSAEFTVLEQLGGPTERVRTTQAADWTASPTPVDRNTVDRNTVDRNSVDRNTVDPLNVIAIQCPADGPVLSTAPGLPDDAYEHDGQLTKREVRAVTLSRLAPVPGQLLWDVGGGAGSIAIEWSRHHPSCRAIAVERDPDRAKRLERNVTALGAAVDVVEGAAPAALDGLEQPDAIFIGGGATAPGMVDTCWNALRPGGRLVANGVTLETEALIAQWYKTFGGDLIRLQVQRASAVGGMTGWRPAMPVTIWSVTK